MPFPVSAKGTLDVQLHREADAEKLITAVVSAIRNESPSDLSRQSNEILFRGGVFRLVWNWNQLVSITSGFVRISFIPGRARVDYRITFTQMLILVPAMLAFLCIPFLTSPRSELPPWQLLLFGWPWLFGMNYLSTCVRFPRFLRRAIDGALRSDPTTHATNVA